VNIRLDQDMLKQVHGAGADPRSLAANPFIRSSRRRPGPRWHSANASGVFAGHLFGPFITNWVPAFAGMSGLKSVSAMRAGSRNRFCPCGAMQIWSALMQCVSAFDPYRW